ncbi:C40 family peptidase [Clostridium gasigenes]|uniref:NlpC/P60 family protein n=1 Tax=Clostridium gasigenes TaxID=94869 RepID=UPI0016258A87|nr:NlpC/P60 family protein [Clostridium gasigenes]MBB6623844.1 C40 family peptidase [Clostridium gasigenes]
MKIKKRAISIFIATLVIFTMLPKDIAHAAKAGDVWYISQVQDVGWQNAVSDGQTSGTIGLGKRLETFRMEVNPSASYTIEYQAHVQDRGWLPWNKSGENAGTIGESLRLEAIKIKLKDKVTGADPGIDIFYRVHVEHTGWLPWQKNGEIAGTVGQARRIEAMEVQIRTRGDYPNTTTPTIDRGQAIVDQARAHKSLVTYVYGADNQSNHVFDCSSFTKHIFAHQGLSLGRTTWNQMNQGSVVSRADLKAGDLVFTIGGNHVGIYTSNGQMIHNSREGVNVIEGPIYDFYTARRVQ